MVPFLRAGHVVVIIIHKHKSLLRMQWMLIVCLDIVSFCCLPSSVCDSLTKDPASDSVLPGFVCHLHLKRDVLTELVFWLRNLKRDIVTQLEQLLVAVVEGLSLLLCSLSILVLYNQHNNNNNNNK